MRSNKLFHQEGEASEFTDYRVSQATFTSRDHRISDNRVRKDGRVFDVNIESRKNSKFELFRWRQVSPVRLAMFASIVVSCLSRDKIALAPGRACK